LDEAIPMKGRMIHHPASGSSVEKEESQLYDAKRGQCINSISRPILNQRLLEALPEGIKIRFETKLDRVDFTKRLAWGKRSGKGKKRPGQEDDDGAVGSPAALQTDDRGVDQDGTGFDLIIGADGSWSKVRSEMMRVERYVSVLPLQPLSPSTHPAESTSPNHSSLTHTSNSTFPLHPTKPAGSRWTRTICTSGPDTHSCSSRYQTRTGRSH
jgi:2-polyprenyl-6-methoxyphenol hydroxylase-like FAD-dependent oxidoreductase